MRYLFHLAFKGTRYHGWQTQSGSISVQETIETTLGKILGKRVLIHGCGRTDAGVHAAQYFFHTDLEENLEADFAFIINKNLPQDVTIFDILKVPGNFHAQLGTLQREYRYFVHTYPDPFLADLSSFYPGPFHFERMQSALRLIETIEDFTAASLTPLRLDSTQSKLETCHLEWSKDKERFVLIFRGDRFIRGMVRLLTAAVLEVGRGRLNPQSLSDHLHSGQRIPLLPPAYPQGLYLSRIQYPNYNFPVKGYLPAMT